MFPSSCLCSVLTRGVAREFVLEYLALILTKTYNVTVLIPRWLLLVVTGSIASVLVNVLHSSKSIFGSAKSKATPKPKPVEENVKAPKTVTAETTSLASGNKLTKGGTSKRKGAKK